MSYKGALLQVLKLLESVSACGGVDEGIACDGNASHVFEVNESGNLAHDRGLGQIVHNLPYLNVVDRGVGYGMESQITTGVARLLARFRGR